MFWIFSKSKTCDPAMNFFWAQGAPRSHLFNRNTSSKAHNQMSWSPLECTGKRFDFLTLETTSITSITSQRRHFLEPFQTSSARLDLTTPTTPSLHATNLSENRKIHLLNTEKVVWLNPLKHIEPLLGSSQLPTLFTHVTSVAEGPACLLNSTPSAEW